MVAGPRPTRRDVLPPAPATAGGRRARPGGPPAPSRERRGAARAADALDPLYHLLLLDDDQHSYAYVVEMLGAVLGYGREKAYVLARIVDTEGRVIIETGPRDRVTEHQRQIHSYGADPRIATSLGSMSAVVEPALA